MLNSKKTVLFGFESGHGWTKITGAGSAIEDDTVTFRTGTQGLKMTATATNCDAEKAQAINLADKNLLIDVYIVDVTKVGSINLLLDASTGSAWTSYYSVGASTGTFKTGWNTVGFVPTLANKLGSSAPTSYAGLSAIKRARLRLTPTEGQEAVVTVDRICTVPVQPHKGLVTLAFDDGGESVYTVAKPMMDAYGFPGVLNVYPTGVGTAGKVTLAQLQTLYDLGWDITSHGYNHIVLTELDADDLRAEVLGSRQWLIANGFKRGAQHFVSPGGQFNDTTLAEIRKHYATHRVSKNTHEIYPPADPYTLASRIILNTTTVATLQGWVDNAVSSKSWLHLVAHYIMDPADASTKMLPATFQALVDYIAASNVEVVTVSDVLVANGTEHNGESGLVLTDATTGTLYRLKVDSGTLSVEAVEPPAD